MSINQNWRNTTVTRSASVVRVHGFGMDLACSKAAGFSGMPTTKRHDDAIPAAAVRLSWSPPV